MNEQTNVSQPSVRETFWRAHVGETHTYRGRDYVIGWDAGLTANGHRVPEGSTLETALTLSALGTRP